MGCGRVGAWLAVGLEERGHSVAIIDMKPEAFRRLPESFAGRKVTGVGHDPDSIRQAGIEEAAGFAAVSNGDNSNIIAARVVRENFGIKNVVARIYDPHRASVYERLGVPTISTVRWAAQRMLQRLIPLGPNIQYTDSNAGVSLVSCDLHHGWIGYKVQDLDLAIGARVVYLANVERSFVPNQNTVVQIGDQVHVMANTDRIQDVQRILALPPKKESK